MIAPRDRARQVRAWVRDELGRVVHVHRLPAHAFDRLRARGGVEAAGVTLSWPGGEVTHEEVILRADALPRDAVWLRAEPVPAVRAEIGAVPC